MIRMQWGHIAESASLESSGLVTLEHIYWFNTVPASVDGVLFDPAVLAARLIAYDLEDAAIPVTVQVTSADGEPIGPLYSPPPPGEFDRLAPSRLSVRTLLVSLQGLFLPAGADYVFRILAAGELIGGVEFSVRRMATE